jgi:hypothetical protein
MIAHRKFTGPANSLAHPNLDLSSNLELSSNFDFVIPNEARNLLLPSALQRSSAQTALPRLIAIANDCPSQIHWPRKFLCPSKC